MREPAELFNKAIDAPGIDPPHNFHGNLGGAAQIDGSVHKPHASAANHADQQEATQVVGKWIERDRDRGVRLFHRRIGIADPRLTYPIDAVPVQLALGQLQQLDQAILRLLAEIEIRIRVGWHRIMP